MKKCSRTSQREALVELIYEGLRKRQDLKKSLKELKRKMGSPSLRNPREREQRKHLKEIESTLKASIKEIEVTVPWIRGRIFKTKIKEIEKDIAIRKAIAKESVESQGGEYEVLERRLELENL